jgi:fluoride exporter
MERFVNLCVVCAGSALGGGARYLIYLWAVARGWTAFPWATLIVNVVGCFFIMVVATVAASVTVSTNLRLFLTTGIMGGLTTYSTFDYETTRLLQDGATATALLNVGATLGACFVAGLLGIVVARLFVGP